MNRFCIALYRVRYEENVEDWVDHDADTDEVCSESITLLSGFRESLGLSVSAVAIERHISCHMHLHTVPSLCPSLFCSQSFSTLESTRIRIDSTRFALRHKHREECTSLHII